MTQPMTQPMTPGPGEDYGFLMDELGAPTAFDQIGERYDDTFHDRSAQITAGGWLIDLLPEGARVLDHGCGSARPTAEQLTQAGLEVTGVDESERMLELARERVPDATFVRQDLRDFDGLGKFDAVTSFFALLMLPRSDIAATLAGLHRLLPTGGPLALSMVEGDLDWVEIPFLGTPIHVSAYPAEQLSEVVQQAGFDVVDMDSMDVETAPGRSEQQLFLRALAR